MRLLSACAGVAVTSASPPRMACDLMNAGTSEQDVVSKLSLLNPGLNSGGAMKFAALASSAY